MSDKRHVGVLRVVSIVVLFNNEHEVLDFAERLNRQSISKNIILVIVVNSRGAMTEAQFQRGLMNLEIESQIYRPTENLGYLNGLIYGYEEFSKTSASPLWIAMSNSDIDFDDDRFFERFLEHEYDEQTWMVGPSVFSPQTGSYANPHALKRRTIHDINRWLCVFRWPILAYYYWKLANTKDRFLKRSKQASRPLYSVHGCFFFVRRDFAELLSRKKYGALMYSEEGYLGEITRLNNMTCYYNSDVEVIHFANTVTSKLGIAKTSKYVVDSLEFLKREFYSS